MSWIKCNSCGYDENDMNNDTCIRCGARLTKPRDQFTKPDTPTIVVKPGQKTPPSVDTPTIVVKPEQKVPVPADTPTIIVKPDTTKPEPKTPIPVDAPTVVVKTTDKTPQSSDMPTIVAKPNQVPMSPGEIPTIAVKSDQRIPVSESVPVMPRTKAKLTIKQGTRKGHEFTFSQDPIVIGRWDAESGCFPEIDITDDDIGGWVSRKHARIFFNNSKYFIEDLSSKNGTFVNKGRRLSPGVPQELNTGDEIIIGKLFFTFTVA